jgi:hypothetical protein
MSLQAPEGRQKLAHGVSRGNGAGGAISPGGAEEMVLLPPLMGLCSPSVDTHGLRRGLISNAPTGLSKPS